jgi:transcriptional regulator with XRE-family HTH domain
MADVQWLIRALEAAGEKPDQHGFTADFARRTGMPRQTITKILTGEVEDPSASVCRALAVVLGWSTVQVMKSFGTLTDEDTYVHGNGPALWKPYKTRAQHFQDAEVQLYAVEDYLGQILPEDRYSFHMRMILQCAQLHAQLATADTHQIAMEAR